MTGPMESTRRLSGGGVALLLHLGDPSGRCQAIEVIARGESVSEVLQRLRAAGLEGVRRPDPGSRPSDEDLAALSDAVGSDFLWRPWAAGGDWMSPDLLLG